MPSSHHLLRGYKIMEYGYVRPHTETWVQICFGAEVNINLEDENVWDDSLAGEITFDEDFDPATPEA